MTLGKYKQNGQTFSQTHQEKKKKAPNKIRKEKRRHFILAQGPNVSWNQMSYGCFEQDQMSASQE